MENLKYSAIFHFIIGLFPCLRSFIYWFLIDYPSKCDLFFVCVCLFYRYFNVFDFFKDSKNCGARPILAVKKYTSFPYKNHVLTPVRSSVPKCITEWKKKINFC